MRDLSTFDTKTEADRGTVVHLDDPRTGDPLFDDDEKTKPMTITVLGADSGKVQEFQRQLRAKLYAKINKRKTADLDVDEADAERIGMIVVATVSWEGIALDGDYLACNSKNAQRLYSDTRFPWLVEQLEAAMRDRRRFLQKPTLT